MARFQILLRVLHAAIFEDWLLKFICLALATMMWIYIDGELTGEVDVPLVLRKGDFLLPPNLEMPEQDMPRYTVRIRAPRSRLQLITADNLAIKKRPLLENAQPGHNPLTLQPADLDGEGLDVVSVRPSDGKTQGIELTEITSRPVSVRVRTHGQPREGFVIGKAVSDPPKVSIEGISQDVERIKEVLTEEVDVSDADQDLVREVGIVPSVEFGGQKIEFHCAQKVHVTIPIHTADANIQMTLDVRTIAPPGIAMEVEPKTVEVKVIGDGNELAAPELKSNILLYAEWPATADRPKDAASVSGPYTVQLHCNAPPRVKVQGIANGTALPTVQVKGSLSAAFNK